MDQDRYRMADVINLPINSSPETAPADKDGVVIPLYLPDKFHHGSEAHDARASRYNLSSDGLQDWEKSALASVTDQFYDRSSTTDAACDYAYAYARNELMNGADLEITLKKVGAFLTEVADESVTSSCQN